MPDKFDVDQFLINNRPNVPLDIKVVNTRTTYDGFPVVKQLPIDWKESIKQLKTIFNLEEKDEIKNV